MTLLAVEGEDEEAVVVELGVVAVDVELGAVDMVEVPEVVDENAESGTTERLASPLSATNTSPFPES